MLKIHFILFERVRGEREIFEPDVRSPKGYNGRNRDDQKITQVDRGTQRLESFSAAFLVHYQGSEMQWPELTPTSLWDARYKLSLLLPGVGPCNNLKSFLLFQLCPEQISCDMPFNIYLPLKSIKH